MTICLVELTDLNNLAYFFSKTISEQIKGFSGLNMLLRFQFSTLRISLYKGRHKECCFNWIYLDYLEGKYSETKTVKMT